MSVFKPLYLLLIALILPIEALAYVGPGAGFGAIAAFVLVAFGVVIAIAGLLWYPMRKLFKAKRRKSKSE